MGLPLVAKETYVLRHAMVDGSSQEVYSFLRSGFNQAPPYIDTTLRVTFRYSSNAAINSLPFGEGGLVTEVTNQARSRFVNKLGSSSSFGATLTAELRQTWGTVANGVTDLYQAARAVRKGNLLRAAQILGSSPPIEVTRKVFSRKKLKGGRFRKTYVTYSSWVMPSGKKVAKSTANKWLWYSYAIKPLVSDIHNGMDVLTRPAPFATKIFASARAERHASQMSEWWTRTTQDSVVSVRMSASVSVRNPNLWLANQMGLVNPVQMFNEGIPFSFVLDWLSNLSQMIMQMTDFVGLDIDKPISSTKQKHVSTLVDLLYTPKYLRSNTWENYDRVLSIPDAKLVFKYERFSWQRGANAISLLVGFLRDVKR